MRTGLVLLLIGLPGVVMAAEDRYGPTRRPDPVLTASSSATPAAREPSGYGGPMLSWSGKPAATTALTPSPRSPAPQPQASQPRAMATASPTPSQTSRLPTGLYDGPAPSAAPRAQTPATPQSPQIQPGYQAPAPAAWPGASASLPPPVSVPPLNSSMTAYSAPRAYSVVREYGGTPDRIPPPPPQSAYSGREVSLDPGLLSEGRDEAPPEEAEDDIEQPARKSAKDRK